MQLIPRKIHLFWMGPENSFVQACIESVRRVNLGWCVVVHNDFREAEAVDGFDNLSIQAKSDWLRLCLIERHGGLWLDASIVCREHVEAWLDVAETRVVGFACPIIGNDNVPIMENWAFAAHPQHPFITKWKHEFATAIRIGLDAYKLNFHDVMGDHVLSSHLPYLSMHAAFLIIRDDGEVVMKPSITDKGPLHVFANSWKSWCPLQRLVPVLHMFYSDVAGTPMIKFTGETRGYAMCYLMFVPTFPDSLMQKHLSLNNNGVMNAWVAILVLCALILVRHKQQCKRLT